MAKSSVLVACFVLGFSAIANAAPTLKNCDSPRLSGIASKKCRAENAKTVAQMISEEIMRKCLATAKGRGEEGSAAIDAALVCRETKLKEILASVR
jgi:hypothetical protein